MKIIPIEGDQMVNGEKQKKFEEILSEIIIAEYVYYFKMLLAKIDIFFLEN